ncbi:hypothetical protein CE195_07430 [Sodalis-like symbiont of Philaenus spumarius]|nr:hypothetical protein CE195_07430 [Sodalis-like symbiont of Philaenus spumarius]
MVMNVNKHVLLSILYEQLFLSAMVLSPYKRGCLVFSKFETFLGNFSNFYLYKNLVQTITNILKQKIAKLVQPFSSDALSKKQQFISYIKCNVLTDDQRRADSIKARDLKFGRYIRPIM